MHIHDFGGSAIISNEDELLTRLKTVRRGEYGAFMLHHATDYPALSIQLNQEFAYLHYFPADDHPGYQAHDMTPNGCTDNVHFLQTNGSEADSFDMPDYTLVSAVIAYSAAIDFFRSPGLPPSVAWFEL